MLRADADHMQREYQQLKAKNDRLERERSELTRQLHEHRKVVHVLEEDHDAVQEVAVQLHNEKLLLESELRERDAMGTSVQSVSSPARYEHDYYPEERTTLIQSERDSAINEAASLREENERLRVANLQLAGDLERAGHLEPSNTFSALSASEARAAEKEAFAAELELELVERQGELARVKSDVVELQATNAKLLEENRDLMALTNGSPSFSGNGTFVRSRVQQLEGSLAQSSPEVADTDHQPSAHVAEKQDMLWIGGNRPPWWQAGPKQMGTVEVDRVEEIPHMQQVPRVSNVQQLPVRGTGLLDPARIGVGSAPSVHERAEVNGNACTVSVSRPASRLSPHKGRESHKPTTGEVVAAILGDEPHVARRMPLGSALLPVTRSQGSLVGSETSSRISRSSSPPRAKSVARCAARITSPPVVTTAMADPRVFSVVAPAPLFSILAGPPNITTTMEVPLASRVISTTGQPGPVVTTMRPPNVRDISPNRGRAAVPARTPLDASRVLSGN